MSCLGTLVNLLENVPPHTSNDLINIGFLVLFYKMFGYNYSEKYTFFFLAAALKDPFLLCKLVVI